MLNCRQATQLLSERLDRELTTKEKLALKMHTAMCTACRRFGQQVEEISHISKIYTQKNNDSEK
jgi:predicted anti-sigma-YlaC factor YlaD